MKNGGLCFRILRAAVHADADESQHLGNGRVWTDGESSKKWHQGYGAGIWFNLSDHGLWKLTVGTSPQGTYVLFGSGFFF